MGGIRSWRQLRQREGSELTRGVDNIVGNSVAFAAVKEDGSVVTWGSADRGGNSDKVKSELAYLR